MTYILAPWHDLQSYSPDLTTNSETESLPNYEYVLNFREDIFYFICSMIYNLARMIYNLAHQI